MININWDEYKHFKSTIHLEGDNFILLLEFLRSYYNMNHAYDLFDTLKNDPLSEMMLDKRNISDASDLEKFIHRSKQS